MGLWGTRGGIVWVGYAQAAQSPREAQVIVHSNSVDERAGSCMVVVAMSGTSSLAESDVNVVRRRINCRYGQDHGTGWGGNAYGSQSLPAVPLLLRLRAIDQTVKTNERNDSEARVHGCLFTCTCSPVHQRRLYTL